MWYPTLVEPREGTPKGHPMARGRSLTEFQKEFPDEASCAAFLFKRRWPDGFVCPSCGGDRAAALKSRAYTFECYGCRRQTSITAGTAMHRTRLALTVWFWAAHLMATHSNGMSARQLEDQLGLTYRTAWLLAQKLRRSMVDPDRELLEGVVEIDQAEMPFREGDTFFEPSNAGKILVIGAVEVIERDTHQSKPRRNRAKYLDTRSGRARLAVIADNTAASIKAFVRANVKPGATLLTDGHASYPGLTGYRHDPRVVGKMAAHVVLPWIHRVFALMKRWGLGTYHGLRRKHADTYLNEFVFRYNRRFYRHASFETVLGLTARHAPASYWDIIGRANPRKGNATPRRTPRSRKTATGMRRDGIGGAENGSQNQAAIISPLLNMDEPGTTQ
jgi:ISXO2-like transposase domain/Transposase zinc-ribbon domain